MKDIQYRIKADVEFTGPPERREELIAAVEKALREVLPKGARLADCKVQFTSVYLEGAPKEIPNRPGVRKFFTDAGYEFD